MKLNSRISDILACPTCHVTFQDKAEQLSCPQCAKDFKATNGIPNFRGACKEEEKALSDHQQEEMVNKTLLAKLYNFGKRFISSEYTPLKQIERFMSEIPENKTVVELGSGNRRLSEDIICIDLFAFPNVNILCDIRWLPIRDASVDYIVIDTVIEHVPEPHKVVDEIFRVLRPGGKVLCIVPFIFPYHAYPKHYFNMSKDALEFLFRHFEDCQVEMNIGPTACLTNLISEYFAIAFSPKRMSTYAILKGLFLLPIFPLKFLDRLWLRNEQSVNMSSILAACATK